MDFACDWPGPIGVPRATKRSCRSSDQDNRCISAKRRPLKAASRDVVTEGLQCQGDSLVTLGCSHLDADSKKSATLWRPLLLPPSLDTPNIPCANSVLLSNHDRTLLAYFRSTTVYYIHSIKDWSPLNYVCQNTATSSSMVMHMILALSAKEMGQSEIRAAYKSSNMAMGVYHYTAALRGLRNCIRAEAEAEGHGDGLEAIFATIFFMINYGLKSTSSLGHVKTHFNGLKSLLISLVRSLKGARSKKRGNSIMPRDIGLSPLSSQFLLWLLYVALLLGLFSSSDASPLRSKYIC